MSERMHSAAESFLRGFHARYPGMTTAVFARGRGPGGRSSYDVLAADAASVAPDRILDLACGDGFLLELVRNALPAATLVGVDFSEEELEAAKSRLKERGVELHHARAQALPLEDASVDVVLCHMALMLMDEVEVVVDELARVLKSGGLVALVVSDGSSAAGAGKLLMRIVRDVSAGTGASMPWLGDGRTRSVEGLVGLFGRRAGFAPHAGPERLEVNLDGDVAQVWADLSMMYNVEPLSQEQRDEVRRRFFEAASVEADASGVARYRPSLLHAVFQRL